MIGASRRGDRLIFSNAELFGLSLFSKVNIEQSCVPTFLCIGTFFPDGGGVVGRQPFGDVWLRHVGVLRQGAVNPAPHLIAATTTTTVHAAAGAAGVGGLTGGSGDVSETAALDGVGVTALLARVILFARGPLDEVVILCQL